jgi:hypothetical protein
MVQPVPHLSREPAAERLANRDAERFTKHDAERLTKHDAERFTINLAERLANHHAGRLAKPDAVRGKPEPQPIAFHAARTSPDAGAGQPASHGLRHWEFTARGRCATGRSASAACRLRRARAC